MTKFTRTQDLIVGSQDLFDEGGSRTWHADNEDGPLALAGALGEILKRLFPVDLHVGINS